LKKVLAEHKTGGRTAMDKIPVIAIVGPTASGKSQLGVELCKRLNGEVISADSMQIYKYMDIATAKPSAAEMKNVPHHMIDFLEPTESFSVVQYCDMARKSIEDITGCGKLPVIVGGTGLYIDALLNNLEFPKVQADFDLRERLKEQAATKGSDFLLNELFQIDPETAQNLNVKDLGRIIRALELYYTTGITMSGHIKMSRLNSTPYQSCFIGLNFRNRQILYDRINSRVDNMLEKGLVEEAKQFFQKYSSNTAQQAIGYKELSPYFEGTANLSQVIEKLKQETRRYAKRQLTWFRKNDLTKWIYVDDYNSQMDITEKAYSLICESGIVRR
jgi:tRNA dimethylallyltransferase